MKLYREKGHFGLISAIVGAIGMLTWLIPSFGLFVSLISIFLGFYSLDDDKNGYSLAGIGLGLISLILILLRSGLVYYYG